MDSQLYLKHIHQALQNSLPGVSAHALLSPMNRPLKDSEIVDLDTYRQAAVAIITFPLNGVVHTIVIQRPDYDGTHGGQVSFPGGKKDASDNSGLDAAIREVEEEIGWRISKSELLTELTEMYIPVSKFRVRPFLFYVESMQSFVPSDREVEEVITFPVGDLLDPEAVKRTSLKISTGIKLKNVPYFDIQNRVVWGATAVILSEFREMLLRQQGRGSF